MYSQNIDYVFLLPYIITHRSSSKEVLIFKSKLFKSLKIILLLKIPADKDEYSKNFCPNVAETWFRFGSHIYQGQKVFGSICIRIS